MVTCLHYIPQLWCLAVGYNFGCFQLWSLYSGALLYSSPYELEGEAWPGDFQSARSVYLHAVMLFLIRWCRGSQTRSSYEVWVSRIGVTSGTWPCLVGKEFFIISLMVPFFLHKFCVGITARNKLYLISCTPHPAIMTLYRVRYALPDFGEGPSSIKDVQLGEVAEEYKLPLSFFHSNERERLAARIVDIIPVPVRENSTYTITT